MAKRQALREYMQNALLATPPHPHDVEPLPKHAPVCILDTHRQTDGHTHIYITHSYTHTNKQMHQKVHINPCIHTYTCMCTQAQTQLQSCPLTHLNPSTQPGGLGAPHEALMKTPTSYGYQVMSTPTETLGKKDIKITQTVLGMPAQICRWKESE